MKELFIAITDLKPVHHKHNNLTLTRAQEIVLHIEAPDTG